MESIFNDVKKIMNKYDTIVLTGHKNIDLDALGACLGFYRMAHHLKKEVYIYLEDNISVKSTRRALKRLQKNNININFIKKEQVKNLDLSKTLLIVLDLHQKNMLDYPELVDLIENKMVIDHHIKNKDVISNTKLTYINSKLSSMVEFVVYFLGYYNLSVHPVIATIMLTGMEIDTNSYNIKTSYKTYEAAAKLSLMGANNIDKQSLLQEKIEDYIERINLLKTGYMINSNMAMCIVPTDKFCNKTDLAIIAEKLLEFDKVEASFALGYTEENVVNISSRSLGRINVQKIMNKLGGGGHASEAAAEITDMELNEVKEKIIEIVNR